NRPSWCWKIWHPKVWRSHSQRYLHSIRWDLPAGVLGSSPLRGIGKQHRVRVIDMQEHLPADIKAGEALDGTIGSRHRDMSHALPGFVAEAGGNQFIIAPYRAVEENGGSASQPHLQIFGDAGAGGEEIEMLAARLVRNAKPQRIAVAISSGRMSLAFQIPCALAGDRERQHLDSGRRAIGQCRPKALIQFDRLAPHVFFAQYVEDA